MSPPQQTEIQVIPMSSNLNTTNTIRRVKKIYLEPESRIMPISSNLNTTNTTKCVKKKNKTKEIRLPMELEPEEANKTLYICNLEHNQDRTSLAYVIRAVKLSDLLSSSLPVPLREVANHTDAYLPGTAVGCVNLGSQILFTGPNFVRGPFDNNDVYAFDTQTKDPNASIARHDGNFQAFRGFGMIAELCGKQYGLSYRVVKDVPPFQVFDPKLGRWEGLAEPPFFTTDSKYYIGNRFMSFSYVVAGTKIFASNRECPVCCFDAAHLERGWRMVSTMCNGGPFPFQNKALALDLDDEDERKIIFAYTFSPGWRLHAYLVSLRDSQETITEIGDFKIPRLPFGILSCVRFVHIGGNRACLAVTQVNPFNLDEYDRIVQDKHFGGVIPFQYEVDMTKAEKECLTLEFMSIGCFKYHTKPCFPSQIRPAGCFLLE